MLLTRSPRHSRTGGMCIHIFRFNFCYFCSLEYLLQIGVVRLSTTMDDGQRWVHLCLWLGSRRFVCGYLLGDITYLIFVQVIVERQCLLLFGVYIEERFVRIRVYSSRAMCKPLHCIASQGHKTIWPSTTNCTQN